jgi:MFS family permease
MINAMGAFVFPLLTLILTDKIGLSTAKTGEVLFVFSLLYLPASLLGGKLADSIGRKNVIIVMDLIAILLYITCAILPTGMITVYLILAAAVFMFMADPAHTALISDYTNSETRESAFALSYMGWNLGFAFGPMIAGFLYQKYFVWIFIGDAVTAGMALLLLVFFVKEIYKTSDAHVMEDLKGHEREHHGGSLQVLKERPVLFILPLLMMTFQFSYSQWGFIMPMQVNKLYGPELYGLLASFNGFVVIIFTPLLTKFMKPLKNMTKIYLGGCLYMMGFGMLGIVHTQLAFFCSVLIFTWGEVIFAISFYPLMMNYAPANHRGRISAIVNNISGTGYTIGPLLMGKFLLINSLDRGWLLTGAISAMGLVSLVLVQWLYLGKQKEEVSQLVEDGV